MVAEAEAKDHVEPRSIHFHPTSELLVAVDPDPDTSPRLYLHCPHFPPFRQSNASTKSCFGTKVHISPGFVRSICGADRRTSDRRQQ